MTGTLLIYISKQLNDSTVWQGYYFCETSHLQSFTKIKHSQQKSEFTVANNMTKMKCCIL